MTPIADTKTPVKARVKRTPRKPTLGGRPREVVILVYPDVQSLDVTGPLEVFTGARQLLEWQARAESGGAESARAESARAESVRAESARARLVAAPRDPGYRTHIVSPDGAPVATSSALTLVPHAAMRDAPARIDTLLVAGGPGSEGASRDEAILEWVAARARGPRAMRARRITSVCTGAFVLAAAGLLDGRRATTHWAAAQELARRHPLVNVDPVPIFVRDGSIWTSAGVTAGMDLALALVEQDLGREAALTIARHLVLFLRRPANQSQFSATLAAQEPERSALRDVQRFAVENLAADLSVQALADRAHMSARHFARSFRAESGVTPARYVERLRLEAARRALEDTREPLGAVAARCGFGTPETMRRTFLRALGVGPAEYRRRFHLATGTTGTTGTTTTTTTTSMTTTTMPQDADVAA